MCNVYIKKLVYLPKEVTINYWMDYPLIQQVYMYQLDNMYYLGLVFVRQHQQLPDARTIQLVALQLQTEWCYGSLRILQVIVRKDSSTMPLPYKY